jgi:5-formyltetrahydrofolate cyclo-ligase
MTGAPKKPDLEIGTFASSPCFLHELDDTPDTQQALDVARWRKAERLRLLDVRASLSVAVRAEAAKAIAGHLDQIVGDVSGKIVSGYWPIKSEMDLRPWLMSLVARGATAVMPVVVQQAAPLAFRAWREGVRMERGFWNIPVPAEGDWLEPDILIAPVIGFDPACYRLGYGGGYFDRTLAAAPKTARPIGIGLAACRIGTIYPQPHDIAMTAIVTEAGIACRQPD